MSNPSIDELLAWMQGKSQTYGWGALIAYDRRKTNELLQELYIERFTSGHYLPLVNQSMTSGSTIEHLSGLRFSVPLMSFENASLTASTVTLSLDFVGGMIVTEEVGLGISKVQKILPLNRPQLIMTQPLERVDGEIDGDGRVALNLANEQGADFRATFVLGSLEQIEVGRRFKVFFEENLSNEQKIFPLGTLAGEANDALTPAGFKIRTMAAPGARVRGAPNEGDGAVLVFARMKGRDEGRDPGSDFMYPIPADAGGKVYTGTMWLSSWTLMEDLVREDALREIGNGIAFAPYQGVTDNAWSLVATSGGLEHPDQIYEVDINEGETQSVYINSDWNYMFVPKGENNQTLAIAAMDNQLELSWKCAFTNHYAYKRRRADWWDDYSEGDLDNTSNVRIRLAPELDANGVVHFHQSTREIQLGFKADRHLKYFTDEDHQGTDLLNHTLRSSIFPSFENALEDISVPSIDTFLIRNLLFPGHNALQLNDAFVPGDLALFGRIDPLRTSAIITPRHVTIEAGGKQQFGLGTGVSGITWSVRGTDPDDEAVGSISTSGLYTAPAAGSLFKGYLVAVVTGRGTLNGQEVTSSAMVTVLTSTVAMNPVFQVCQAGKSVELSAEAIAGEPTWSLKDPSLGGSLSTASGKTCTYTAGELDNTRDPVYLDTVLAGNPGSAARAEALVLVRNSYSLLDVVISDDSDPATGQVQLQIIDRGTGHNPDDFGATCEILVGGGTLSPSGLYTQPADASGFVVVLMKYEDEFGTLAGFIVMPLPLPKYDEINRRVSRSLRASALKAKAP